MTSKQVSAPFDLVKELDSEARGLAALRRLHFGDLVDPPAPIRLHAFYGQIVFADLKKSSPTKYLRNCPTRLCHHYNVTGPTHDSIACLARIAGV